MTARDDEITETVLSALAIYGEKLADAQKQFAEGSAEAKRLAASNSIAATLQFLKDVNTPPEWGQVFGYLGIALNDLEIGNVDPILQPTRFDNKHPDGTVRLRIRGFAAATLQLAIDLGHNRDRSAALIADALNQAGFRATKGGRAYSASTMIDWLNDYRQTEAVGEAAEAFRAALDFHRRRLGGFPSGEARETNEPALTELLDGLGKAVAELTP